MPRTLDSASSPSPIPMPPSPTPPLAKLTAPDTGRGVRRERLLGRLDEMPPIVWITAQAGAGKTDLAAAWLQTHHRSGLWYHLDAGDADPATFFAYLARAAGRLTPSGDAGLPVLTPEYALGLPVFARNFFRGLCTRITPAACLVLDDYHDIPPDSPLHALLRAGLEEIPPGFRVIVTSRAGPPAEFARLRAHARLAVLDWKDLRLTEEEARAIATRLGHDPAPDQLRELYRRCDGWAAGLVLMLEHGAGEIPGQESSPAQVFDYFASEILAGLDAATRQFLLRAALLPTLGVRAVAALSGCPDAGERLAELERRNFFTHRRDAAEGEGYVFHPLFRQFLLAAGERAIPADTRRSLKRQAADLLRADGEMESAIALLREIGDWEGMAETIVMAAPALLRQGRLQTLDGWLEPLPESCFVADPWLDYFAGLCRFVFHPARGRGHFVRAYAGFGRRNDVRGQYLAWAGIGDGTLQAFDGLGETGPWLDELDRLLAHHPLSLDPDTEIRVLTTALGVMELCRPGHPAIGAWADRIEQQAPHLSDPHTRRVAAFRLLLHHTWWRGDATAARRIIARFAIPGDDGSDTPFAQLLWQVARIHHGWITADVSACRDALARAQTLAEQSGIRVMEFHLRVQTVWEAAFRQDWSAAGQALDSALDAMPGARGMDLNQYHWLLLLLAKARRDRAGLQAQARELRRISRGIGAAATDTYVLLGTLLERLAEGRHDELPDLLAQARATALASDSAIVIWDMLFTAVEAAQRSGGDIDAALGEFFAFGERHSLMACYQFIWDRDNAAAFCRRALELGQHTGHVQRLIRHHGLIPGEPPLHLDTWSWPVRIHTLGRFGIELDGEPLAFTASRVPVKPMELLKALIALGGREVPQERLADLLWPEADGDAALRAFHTNLNRLRGLIGKASLTLREGRLSLDPGRVWTDLAAVNAILDELAAFADGGDIPPLPLVERLLSLAQGVFLPHDDALPWTMESRVRLGKRLAGGLAGLSRKLQACAPSLAERCHCAAVASRPDARGSVNDL